MENFLMNKKMAACYAETDSLVKDNRKGHYHAYFDRPYSIILEN